jgi:hypothetical protein
MLAEIEDGKTHDTTLWSPALEHIRLDLFH